MNTHHITIAGEPWCTWLACMAGQDIDARAGRCHCGHPDPSMAEAAAARLRPFFVEGAVKIEPGPCPLQSQGYVLRITAPDGEPFHPDDVENLSADASFDGLTAIAEEDEDDEIGAVLVMGLRDLAQVKRIADRYGKPGGSTQAFELRPVNIP